MSPSIRQQRWERQPVETDVDHEYPFVSRIFSTKNVPNIHFSIWKIALGRFYRSKILAEDPNIRAQDQAYTISLP